MAESRLINLQPIPSQTVRVDTDDARITMRIFAAAGLMCCDVDIDDQRLLSGQRIVVNMPIIPYKHLGAAGNFVIVTDADEDVTYRKFSSSQHLVYGYGD